ncbi:hypothetical protein CW745_01310 [Psychromonas sp. psych-6C06]|uniref:hypothetical protein n=1 Tax=Psychromonas sp. psych-6C06 TaxID=2058089 RepID=UPI000C32A17E|nr:hypothetical protein [Psychromonas sp. psych-6C06]PKF63518.1 hypothetical protein CW745_01310 [Psychromonas sp. psych-6C06]
MIKKSLVVFFTIISILLCAILFLQIDNEVDPNLQRILDSEHKTDNEAYFFLLGFMAGPMEDPVSTGKKYFADIEQQQRENLKRPVSEQFLEFNVDPGLPELKGSLLCRYSEENCLATIFNAIESIPALITKHQIYMQRFDKFTDYQDFQTLTEASILEPLLDYSPIINTVRLLSLKQIYRAASGETKESINALLYTHDQIRKQLTLQDTIIGKLIFLNLLSENIDLIYLISRNHNEILTTEIQPLNTKERSLLAPLNREIKMMNNLYQSLDKAPDIFHKVGETNGFRFPTWLTRALFKPNMSSNESYKPLHYYAKLSEANITRFSEQLLTQSDYPTLAMHHFRNWIGTVLTQMATTDYSKIIARFWSINNKIRLFNTNICKPSMKHSFDQATNLFPSLKHEKAYLRENETQVCLNSPNNDVMQYDCLQIKIN